jgi:glycosyltransferase involved in cell wall biosynthesis
MTQMQLPDDKHIILLPGRMTRLKGHGVLLDALSRLNRDDVVCLFVGSTANKEAYVKELEDQAVNYGLRDRLYIIPECKDMAALYKLATLTVCPSVQPESFGRVAAEAGAMGCVVVASNHGGAPEIIVEGKTGFLFPPEDCRSLTYTLQKVLDMTQQEGSQIKHDAMEHVRKSFDNATMLSKTIKLYHDLVS